MMDQFLRPAKSQSNWYGLSSDHKADPTAVSTWCTGITSTHPTSRRISQETLRRWEKSAREATVICNQAASFNRCLFKVQQNMQEQFKIVRSESKGKSSSKVPTAMEEMQYLMNFNSSICQAAAKTMENLTEFGFISMGNLTLACRDSYLTHIKTGIKPDTLAGLYTAPIHIETLFPDHLIKKAEEEIVHFESLQVQRARVGTTPMKGRTGKQTGNLPSNRTGLPAKTLTKLSTREVAGKQHTTPRDQPRASSPINDNHCVDKLQGGLLAGSQTSTQEHLINSSVNLNVVNPVHTAPGHSQKKGVSPRPPVCHMPTDYKLKYVKGISWVTQLCCVKPVTNVKLAAQNLPVGARLQNFWQTWLHPGCRSEGSSNPERGLHPPLSDPAKTNKVSDSRKLLCQSSQEQLPVGGITSAYRQKCNRTGPQSNISGVFQQTIFSPQTQQQMETYTRPEQTESLPQDGKIQNGDIRTSLQQGEWVTSIDFKDAYFHIPIQEQSRKYLRFHVQGQTYQFKALPFGLSTAPLEFTVVAKEVKLMATQKGIRVHQYLDDWLVRVSSHRVCLQHTQILVKMCQRLGWLVNVEKSELEPKQVFDFVGYQFDFRSGQVRPTLDRWQNLQDKILEILSSPACPVRQFMSLIGLLTATEKQVHLGRLHMRPIQWHLKNNWSVPESLEKVIPIPRSLHPHLQWWLDKDNVLTGQPLHPIKHALQIFTDTSKEGWGASLKRAYCKGNLVPTRKQAAYKLPRTQSSFLSIKRVPRPLHKQDSSCSNRQYHSGSIYKQGRRYEIGSALRPSVEDLDLVYQTSSNPQSLTYPGPSKCDSRQTIQTRPDHPDRVVSLFRGLPSYMQQVAPASSGLVCHKVQQQVASISVTGTRSHGHSSGCTQSAMGGSGCLRLPTNSHLGQSGGEVV